MDIIFGIITIFLIGGLLLFFLGIAAVFLYYFIVFILLFLLGSFIYALFEWPGLIIFILVCVLLFLSGYLTKGKSGERRPAAGELEKMKETDEELEDYDYLDDMTGKDDKPWM